MSAERKIELVMARPSDMYLGGTSYMRSDESRDLRMRRQGSKLSMGIVAGALGISAVDLSGLESGRFLLCQRDWATVFEALSKLEVA